MTESIENQDKAQIPMGYYDQFGVNIPSVLAGRVSTDIMNPLMAFEIANGRPIERNKENDDSIDILHSEFMIASQLESDKHSTILLSEAYCHDIKAHYLNFARERELPIEDLENAAEIFTELKIRLRQTKGGQTLPLSSKESVGFGPDSISSWLRAKGEKGAKDGLG